MSSRTFSLIPRALATRADWSSALATDMRVQAAGRSGYRVGRHSRVRCQAVLRAIIAKVLSDGIVQFLRRRAEIAPAGTGRIVAVPGSRGPGIKIFGRRKMIGPSVASPERCPARRRSNCRWPCHGTRLERCHTRPADKARSKRPRGPVWTSPRREFRKELFHKLKSSVRAVMMTSISLMPDEWDDDAAQTVNEQVAPQNGHRAHGFELHPAQRQRNQTQ